MNSFDQSPHPSGQPIAAAPGPAPTYNEAHPAYGASGFPGGPNPMPGTVTRSEVRSGRSRFLGFLAATVLAAGTGVVGFTAAGGMIGGDDGGQARTELSSAGDQADSDGADPESDRSTGGDDTADVSDDGSSEGGTADEGTEGQTPVPGAAMTVEQANASVIRIEATGEFADPEFGTIEGVGSGSGFIIEETGIAVTNNHVVAGAAFIEVFVPGEDRPRNARILATSECSDLAVIDIEGDGFPIVTLNMVSPVVGTDVYAAGYPLGDPEFTLTKGIVSRAETRGDTHLSSVDGVLEHDARINPGNSGGPLFDQFGQVVGINYQGNRSTDQSFAITAADAIGIIDQLRAGNSVDSIGVNGQIVDLGDR
ncbi:MAG: trypsin-like peptidase domain-containing protein, partial [Actinomycetota bacterium]